MLKQEISEEVLAIAKLNRSILELEPLEVRIVEEQAAEATIEAHSLAAFAELLGASVRTLPSSALSVEFEHAWLPLVCMKFQWMVAEGGESMWTLRDPKLPADWRLEDVDGPHPWRFWQSKLLKVSGYVAVRAFRAVHWRKLAKIIEAHLDSIELNSNGTTSFYLVNDIGRIDLDYDDAESFLPSLLTCTDATGGVVTASGRDSTATADEPGAWSQTSPFQEENEAFFSECIDILLKSA